MSRSEWSVAEQFHTRAAGLEVRRAVEIALALWCEGDDAYAHQSIQRMSEIARRFEKRLAANGVIDFFEVRATDCEAFIAARGRNGAPVSVSTSRFRRTTLRALFRSVRLAGYPVSDPTVDVVLPPRPITTARPLADEEVVLCRTVARTVRAKDLRRPAAWALAEAGAVTSEQAQVRIGDLDSPCAPSSVRLSGTRRVRARTVSLTDWGRRIVASRVQELGSSDPSILLVYGGSRHADSACAQAATCNLVGNVLRDAGLAHDARVRPTSVRHWRAAALFEETGSIADVANLLGQRSLDEAADAIGWEWQGQ